MNIVTLMDNIETINYRLNVFESTILKIDEKLNDQGEMLVKIFKKKDKDDNPLNKSLNKVEEVVSKIDTKVNNQNELLKKLQNADAEPIKNSTILNIEGKLNKQSVLLENMFKENDDNPFNKRLTNF